VVLAGKLEQEEIAVAVDYFVFVSTNF